MGKEERKGNTRNINTPATVTPLESDAPALPMLADSFDLASIREMIEEKKRQDEAARQLAAKQAALLSTQGAAINARIAEIDSIILPLNQEKGELIALRNGLTGKPVKVTTDAQQRADRVNCDVCGQKSRRAGVACSRHDAWEADNTARKAAKQSYRSFAQYLAAVAPASVSPAQVTATV
jgi:hypothetical protein